MAYEVILSKKAEEQAEAFIDYLAYNKANMQAVKNLLKDMEDTKESLSLIAGSLGFCKDPDLAEMGYRIMLFRRHRYLWIYQVNGNRAEVKAMYHQLQDYENTFKTDKD